MFSRGWAPEPWGGGGAYRSPKPQQLHDGTSCRAGLPLRDLQGATKDMERQGPQTFRNAAAWTGKNIQEVTFHLLLSVRLRLCEVPEATSSCSCTFYVSNSVIFPLNLLISIYFTRQQNMHLHLDHGLFLSLSLSSYSDSVLSSMTSTLLASKSYWDSVLSSMTSTLLASKSYWDSVLSSMTSTLLASKFHFFCVGFSWNLKAVRRNPGSTVFPQCNPIQC